MKFLNGKNYVEIKGKRYSIHPSGRTKIFKNFISGRKRNKNQKNHKVTKIDDDELKSQTSS